LALSVPLSRFTSLVGGGSAFYVRHRPRFMKNRTPLIVTALLVSLFTGCSKHPQPATTTAQPASNSPSVYAGRWPDEFHANQMRFSGLYPVQALQVYAKLTDASLDISPEVKSLQSGIYWTNHEDMTRSQVTAELEKVLRSQAGVVIRHVDATHITVTYDASATSKPSE
jgi:hypothetical protein